MYAESLFLVIADITERKQAEDALKKSSEKIKLFAYSVSHDLKSPAIGIYRLTKLLHKHYKYILDKKGKSYCDQILKASEQIAALVEQINVYISTKEVPLAIESIKLKEILRMVREEFSAQLNIRQTTFLNLEREIRTRFLGSVNAFRHPKHLNRPSCKDQYWLLENLGDFTFKPTTD